jgi:O-antigen ligase
MSLTGGRASTLEWIGFLLITLSLGLVQLKLLLGQGILFSAAALVWLAVAIRDRRRPDTPAFFVPLLAFAAWTLVSAGMSSSPIESFTDSKQLLMFLMVPIVARFCRGPRASQTIDVIIAIGAAGALVGIVQFAMLGYDHLNNRPVGLLSHWMTFSGVLMMVTCAAVARLVFRPSPAAWPMIAVPALLVALGVTYTRNAWIGTFLGVCVLLAIRNWKLVLIAPVVAAVALVVAPGQVQDRARSIFDTSDPANRDRIVMWKIGADMVRDHPVFGVGPEMIHKRYVEYRVRYPEAVNEHNQHLHNAPIQIAAERGIPALVIWLWFVVVAARDLWRQIRARIATDVAGAGLAALVAMLAAGLFEWNFGDSEFLMLLLGLLTLPYAAARRSDPAVAPGRPAAAQGAR